ncbi:MAG TPA: YjjG family noncanonical pyrimidine nucleotidase [Candidatus Sulfomarinibacteraceae bacterium]|nr:YjjG family noncanonical pyrimidine nucleotidase [Candidatus Sulfomarinibacteraceae bacterium]
MTYAWIFFDADGTLFDYASAEAAALEGGFRALGLSWDPAYGPLYTGINAAIWLEFERGEIDQVRLRTERFERLFAEVGLAADTAEFSRCYLEVLARQAALLPGAEAVVRRLTGSHEMLLLTNGLAEVQRPRFAAAPIRDCFADVVISEEVGLAKPDPAIFDLALERVGSPERSTVLVVGDSLSSDIAGGAAAGLDTCWFNPEGAGNGHGVAPTHEIRRLRQLLEIVGP